MSKIDRESIGEILQEPRSVTSVKWKIPMFFSLPKHVDYCIKSPSFKFLDSDFYLELYPKENTEESKEGFIHIYVVKKHSSTYIHNIEYIIGIEEANGQLYKVWGGFFDYEGKEDCGSRLMFVERQQLLSNKIRIAPGDTLTFLCILQSKQMDGTETTTQTTLCEGQEECTQTALGSTGEIAKEVNDRKVVSPNLAGWDSFSQSMKNLLKAKFLCDITIKLKDEELRAHKIVLAAHSSVFSAMFAHEMSEKNTGIIEIFDFESNVFKEFLQYLYTGHREALSQKNICELYGLAHKYNVKHLQEECVSTMFHGLTVDTFCDIISLAVKYGESELTKEATKFFLKNTEHVLILTKWQVLCTKTPQWLTNCSSKQ